MEFAGISEILLGARFSLATKNTLKLDRNEHVSIFIKFSSGDSFSEVTVKDANPLTNEISTHKARVKGGRYFTFGALIGLSSQILERSAYPARELPSCQCREAMLPNHLPFCMFASFARGYASAMSGVLTKQIFMSANCMGMKANNSIYTVTASTDCILVNGNGMSKEVTVPLSLKFRSVRVGMNVVYVWSKTGLERVDRLLASVSRELARSCQLLTRLQVREMQT